MPDTLIQLPASMRVFERGWLSSNNILFMDDDTAALVDSGYVTHAPQTLALLQHALQGRALDLLLNTHLHSDHCGGNALLQQTYDCRTLIPVADMPAVAAWDERHSPTPQPASSARLFVLMAVSRMTISCVWAGWTGRCWRHPGMIRIR
jgi:glyoxylase-like metal-dependent hydrolase (beta-lactamase superfamily II)